MINNVTNKLFAPKQVATKLGTCAVQIERIPLDKELYELSLNHEGQKLASELFQITKNGKSMLGLEIITKEPYRQKGFRFGEILRLFSVMELMQNKLSNIMIISRPKAVIFHKKYKFKPDLGMESIARTVLEKISRDDIEKPAERAKKCLSDFNIDEANDITDEFLSTIICDNLEPRRHELSVGIPMTLDADEVKKHSEFFNNLYKKHGLDFTI